MWPPPAAQTSSTSGPLTSNQGILLRARAGRRLVERDAHGRRGEEAVARAGGEVGRAGAAGLVGVDPERRAARGLHLGHRGLDEERGVGALAGEGLVDEAVAVVVLPVAELGPGLAAVLHGAALRGIGPVADQGAEGAADAVARRGLAQVARAGIAEVEDVLVGGAVAVVVERVADLGRGGAGGVADGGVVEAALPQAGLAGDLHAPRGALARRRAGADAADLGRRGREHALVDLAVAVVVDAVARLGRRDEDARVLARVVGGDGEVVVARLAALEGAGAGDAAPIGVDRAGEAVVAARATVVHVGRGARLVGELTVAVRVDVAPVAGRGRADGAVADDAAPWQALAPALHADTAPGGGGIGALQGPTLSAGGRPPAESMTPSQSSSCPLQVSTPGLTAPRQTRAPPWHWKTPKVQGKLLLAPQDPPTLVGLSSTTPSQSSSFPLQVSCCRLGTSTAAPSQTIWPPRQALVPACFGSAHSPSRPPKQVTSMRDRRRDRRRCRSCRRSRCRCRRRSPRRRS